MHRVDGSFSGLTLLIASLFVQGASAQIVVDPHGFEPPFFSTTFLGTGQLEGQDGWLTAGSGLSTAKVQTAVVANGNQAVRVDRASHSDRRWTVPVGGYPTGNFISIVWDMRVNQTSGPAGTFGPYFGVEAYDAEASSLGLLGSLGVDASTSHVLFQAEGAGFLTETGHVVGFGTWHSYQLRLDYSTKTYSYYLDGAQLGTEGFVDENNVAGGLNAFTDADIAAFAAAGDFASQTLTGTAYFDNFIVIDGVSVPMLAGDYNRDGTVNAADYTVWRDTLGSTTNFAADGNGNGTIDTADYNFWRAHFGETGGLGVGAVVPEPRSSALLLIGGITLALFRRCVYNCSGSVVFSNALHEG